MCEAVFIIINVAIIIKKFEPSKYNINLESIKIYLLRYISYYINRLGLRTEYNAFCQQDEAGGEEEEGCGFQQRVEEGAAGGFEFFPVSYCCGEEEYRHEGIICAQKHWRAEEQQTDDVVAEI